MFNINAVFGCTQQEHAGGTLQPKRDSVERCAWTCDSGAGVRLYDPAHWDRGHHERAAAILVERGAHGRAELVSVSRDAGGACRLVRRLLDGQAL